MAPMAADNYEINVIFFGHSVNLAFYASMRNDLVTDVTA